MAAEQATQKKGTSDSLGTGRRKTAVARVRIRAGNGTVHINQRALDHYFHNERDRADVLAPLAATGHLDNVDVLVKVHGGGSASQAGAIKLGVARALLKYDPAGDQPLREQQMLTRDGRMKERKKYGLRGARRGTQFSKR